jgi:hypothetical protein
MSREHTGTITVRKLSDGTRAFQLRFNDKGRRERVTLHERRSCPCGCGGGWTPRTAAVELKNIVTRVEAGVWQKSAPPRPKPERMPTVNGHRFLPSGGHRTSPPADMFSPRWWPSVLPALGERVGRRGAEPVGRGGAAIDALRAR